MAAVGENVFPGTRDEAIRLKENVLVADVGEDVSVMGIQKGYIYNLY